MDSPGTRRKGVRNRTVPPNSVAINEALAAFRGSLRAMARGLGVNRTTVRQWFAGHALRAHQAAHINAYWGSSEKFGPAPRYCMVPRCADAFASWHLKGSQTRPLHHGCAIDGCSWCLAGSCSHAKPWPLLPMTIEGRGVFGAYHFSLVRDNRRSLTDLLPEIFPRELPLLHSWALHLSRTGTPWAITSGTPATIWPLALWRIRTKDPA